MNILLIGSGGREHALAWKMASSPLLTKLWCAPGNAGIAQQAECIALDVADHAAVIAFCKQNKVDLVVVGPEVPLAAGIVDDLAAGGIKAFGPSKAASQLEGSKAFTKELCRENNIPTAEYGAVRTLEEAEAYINARNVPLVVKMDGLFAGKGVTVPSTVGATISTVQAIYRDGPSLVVLEEVMIGEEASFFVLCDGEHGLPLATAQDHKRAFDGDKGPNTGGMGAYSPAPVMTNDMIARTMQEIINPTLRAMAAKGMPFKGVLFAGLMITTEGPKLIEYNARFGDPETQVLMLRLMSDLIPALLASVDGQLKNFDLRWFPEPALTVVMAARGYPGDYAKGSRIEGLDQAAEVEGVEIFHAGTKSNGTDILANGGRVLNIAASGKTVSEAQRRAYEAIGRIKWPDGFCRRDIGWQAIAREKEAKV
jgi:phosphoribosylamine--glycine ligase